MPCFQQHIRDTQREQRQQDHPVLQEWPLSQQPRRGHREWPSTYICIRSMSFSKPIVLLSDQPMNNELNFSENTQNFPKYSAQTFLDLLPPNSYALTIILCICLYFLSQGLVLWVESFVRFLEGPLLVSLSLAGTRQVSHLGLQVSCGINKLTNND